MSKSSYKRLELPVFVTNRISHVTKKICKTANKEMQSGKKMFEILDFLNQSQNVLEPQDLWVQQKQF